MRLALLGLGAWAAGHVPLPLLDDWLPVRNLVTAAATVMATGKLLYDTLFYDRFQP